MSHAKVAAGGSQMVCIESSTVRSGPVDVIVCRYGSARRSRCGAVNGGNESELKSILPTYKRQRHLRVCALNLNLI